MIVAGIYSFNGGKKIIESRYPAELEEIMQLIKKVDSSACKTKVSNEKSRPGKLLYSPAELKVAFKKEFTELEWKPHKIACDYPTQHYVSGYTAPANLKNTFRGMEFVKNTVAAEVQFGKYAFMVYNVCAKMIIFHKKSIINVGIEIVPVKEFANQMSTGVSYFEQLVWELEQRGVSNVDIPVLVLGITDENSKPLKKF